MARCLCCKGEVNDDEVPQRTPLELTCLEVKEGSVKIFFHAPGCRRRVLWPWQRASSARFDATVSWLGGPGCDLRGPATERIDGLRPGEQAVHEVSGLIPGTEYTFSVSVVLRDGGDSSPTVIAQSLDVRTLDSVHPTLGLQNLKDGKKSSSEACEDTSTEACGEEESCGDTDSEVATVPPPSTSTATGESLVPRGAPVSARPSTPAALALGAPQEEGILEVLSPAIALECRLCHLLRDCLKVEQPPEEPPRPASPPSPVRLEPTRRRSNRPAFPGVAVDPALVGLADLERRNQAIFDEAQARRQGGLFEEVVGEV